MKFLALGPILCLCALAAQAAQISLAESEARSCDQEIAALTAEMLRRYAGALEELQTTYQKTADLEGAVAVRGELGRLTTEGVLTEKNLVTEPKSLRDLQQQTLGRISDFCVAIVQKYVPRLVEIKKQLTTEGKLDEALAVRTHIERLQTTYLPTQKVAPGALISADTLVGDFLSERTRADKLYKGRKITVSGPVAGFQADPNDPKRYSIFLSPKSGNGLVQCIFHTQDFSFREDRASFGNIVLSIRRSKADSELRLQKGTAMEIEGTCEGLDGNVRMDHCSIPAKLWPR